MSDTRPDADIIHWAIQRSRSRPRKSYPWHELQEIALAIEHGLSEAEAMRKAEESSEPLSQVLPPTLRNRHDTARVEHLRALISKTNWSQTERAYDEAQRQSAIRMPLTKPTETEAQT